MIEVLIGFIFFAVGAVVLAAATGGIVVGSIVCMAWGVFFVALPRIWAAWRRR